MSKMDPTTANAGDVTDVDHIQQQQQQQQVEVYDEQLVCVESSHGAENGSEGLHYPAEVIVEGQQMNKVCVRFSKRPSVGSRSGSLANCKKRESCHVTNNIDPIECSHRVNNSVLPFPLQVSRGSEECNIDTTTTGSFDSATDTHATDSVTNSGTNCTTDYGTNQLTAGNTSWINESSGSHRLANKVRDDIASLEKYLCSVEKDKRDLEEVLRVERETKGTLVNQVEELKRQFGVEVAEKQKLKEELGQVHERAVNEWKLKRLMEEELIKLRHSSSSDSNHWRSSGARRRESEDNGNTLQSVLPVSCPCVVDKGTQITHDVTDCSQQQQPEMLLVLQLQSRVSQLEQEVEQEHRQRLQAEHKLERYESRSVVTLAGRLQRIRRENTNLLSANNHQQLNNLHSPNTLPPFCHQPFQLLALRHHVTSQPVSDAPVHLPVIGQPRATVLRH